MPCAPSSSCTPRSENPRVAKLGSSASCCGTTTCCGSPGVSTRTRIFGPVSSVSTSLGVRERLGFGMSPHREWRSSTGTRGTSRHRGCFMKGREAAATSVRMMLLLFASSTKFPHVRLFQRKAQRRTTATCSHRGVLTTRRSAGTMTGISFLRSRGGRNGVARTSSGWSRGGYDVSILAQSLDDDGRGQSASSLPSTRAGSCYEAPRGASFGVALLLDRCESRGEGLSLTFVPGRNADSRHTSVGGRVLPTCVRSSARLRGTRPRRVRGQDHVAAAFIVRSPGVSTPSGYVGDDAENSTRSRVDLAAGWGRRSPSSRAFLPSSSSHSPHSASVGESTSHWMAMTQSTKESETHP